MKTGGGFLKFGHMGTSASPSGTAGKVIGAYATGLGMTKEDALRDLDWTVADRKDAELKAAPASPSQQATVREGRNQLQSFDDTDYTASHAYALAQIMIDTGLSESKAREIQRMMLDYYGSYYDEFTQGRRQAETEAISRELLKMPYYNAGTLYRGMDVDNTTADHYLQDWTVGKTVGFTAFRAYEATNLGTYTGMWEDGEIATVTVTSWTSRRSVADDFSRWRSSQGQRTSIVFQMKDNKTVPGVQHISTFGYDEAEALAPAGHKFRIDKVTITYNGSHRQITFDVTDDGIRDRKDWMK